MWPGFSCGRGALKLIWWCKCNNFILRNSWILNRFNNFLVISSYNSVEVIRPVEQVILWWVHCLYWNNANLKPTSSFILSCLLRSTVVWKSLGTPLRLHDNLLCLHQKRSQWYIIHFLVNTEYWGVFQTKIFSVAVFSCVKWNQMWICANIWAP